MRPIKPEELSELKKWLAESLVRSDTDYMGDFLNLGAFQNVAGRWQGSTAVEIKELWGGFLGADLPTGHFLSLYQHFPYCLSRCTFCVASACVPPNREAIGRYVEDSLEAIGLVPDGLIRKLSIVGTPAQCRQRLEELRAAGLELAILNAPGPRRVFGQPVRVPVDPLETCGAIVRHLAD